MAESADTQDECAVAVVPGSQVCNAGPLRLFRDSTETKNLVGCPEGSSAIFFAAATMAVLKKLDAGLLCLSFIALP